MSMISDAFLKCKVLVYKLIPYGFIKNNENYVISKNILNDSFNVVVTINKDNQIDVKVIDNELEEEYENFKSDKQVGSFVNKVREEVLSFLNDIKTNCFVSTYFVSNQANRIAKLIEETYNDLPEFLWEDENTSGVFRNKTSNKWYGIIMNIKKNRLDNLSHDVMVDVMNVKLDETLIQQLWSKEGFYKAYHMNKKSWISIILDETLSDETILKYIKQSKELTDKK